MLKPIKLSLCINADDYGFSPYISEGIIDMMKQGLVSSTSVMVQNVESKQMDLLAQQPNISVGLHFNFASNKNNFVPFLNNPFTIAKQFYLGKLKLAIVERELDSQYKELKKLYSGTITHLDTHQHIHIIPAFAGLLNDFAKQNNIQYVRLGKEASPTGGPKKWLFNNSAKNLKNQIPLFGLNIMGSEFNANKIKQQFNFLKERNVSKAIWIVHPGYESTNKDFIDSYNLQRQKEISVLIELKNFIYDSAEIVPITHFYGA